MPFERGDALEEAGPINDDSDSGEDSDDNDDFDASSASLNELKEKGLAEGDETPVELREIRKKASRGDKSPEDSDSASSSGSSTSTDSSDRGDVDPNQLDSLTQGTQFERGEGGGAPTPIEARRLRQAAEKAERQGGDPREAVQREAQEIEAEDAAEELAGKVEGSEGFALSEKELEKRFEQGDTKDLAPSIPGGASLDREQKFDVAQELAVKEARQQKRQNRRNLNQEASPANPFKDQETGGFQQRDTPQFQVADTVDQDPFSGAALRLFNPSQQVTGEFEKGQDPSLSEELIIAGQDIIQTSERRARPAAEFITPDAEQLPESVKRSENVDAENLIERRETAAQDVIQGPGTLGGFIVGGTGTVGKSVEIGPERTAEAFAGGVETLGGQISKDPKGFVGEELREEAGETVFTAGAGALTPSVNPEVTVDVPSPVRTAEAFVRGELGPETSVNRVELPREQAEGTGFGADIEQPQQAGLRETDRGDDFVETREIDVGEDTVTVSQRRAETISRTDFLRDALTNTRKGEARITPEQTRGTPKPDTPETDIETRFREEVQTGVNDTLTLETPSPQATLGLETGSEAVTTGQDLEQRQPQRTGQELQPFQPEDVKTDNQIIPEFTTDTSLSFVTQPEPVLQEETQPERRIEFVPETVLRSESSKTPSPEVPDKKDEDKDEGLLGLIGPGQETDIKRSVGADILGLEDDDVSRREAQNPLSLRPL